MKWYKLLLLLAIAPLFLFTNSDCGKCKDCPVYTDTLFHDLEFLDYWYFPEGSWWVYQRMDTNAQVFDTAKVVYEKNEIRCLYLFEPYCSQEIYLKISHSNQHYKVDESTPEMHLSAGLFQNELTSLAYNTDFFYYSNFFVTPLSLISGGAFTLIDSAATITTPYGELDSVVSIQIYFKYKQSVWLKKDVGFVKFLHRDGSIWELADYFINE